MVYREVVRVLVNAGWAEIRVKGSHHIFKHPDYASNVPVPCHNGRDISLGVLKSIEKATGLSLTR